MKYDIENSSLTSLMVNNEQFEKLINLFQEKLKTAVLFFQEEEFVSAELDRISKQYILPIQVTDIVTGQIPRGFNYTQYVQEAYNWLKMGHDWKLSQIITSAKSVHLAALPELSFNEQEFVNSLIYSLEKGVAYLMYEKFLKEELVKINQSIKTSRQTLARKRVAVPLKLRALLQKEIDSICLFCPSEDVDHFEIHHIDENPVNNNMANLIMVCPTCHSKITKGDISRQAVIEKKQSLQNNSRIEFAHVTIDSKCSWENRNNPYAFYEVQSNRHPYPVLEFTFINHFRRTIILRNIKLRVKYLPHGISGISVPWQIPMVNKYRIVFNRNNEIFKVKNLEPFQIHADQAFRIQVELAEGDDNSAFVPDDRLVLSFEFEFSSNISVVIPKVFLNCENEDERIKIYRVS